MVCSWATASENTFYHRQTQKCFTEEPVAFRTSTFVALLQSRRGKFIAAYVFIFTDLLYSTSLKRDTLVGSPVGKTIVNFNEVVGNLPALGSVSAAQSIIITP